MNYQFQKDDKQADGKRNDLPFDTKLNALLSCALTADAMLAMGFDLTTGERVVSIQDVIPRNISEDVRLIGVHVFLYAQAAHPDDRHKLSRWMSRLNALRQLCQSLASFGGELRARGFAGNAMDYRWYRIRYAFVRNTANQHIYCYLTMTDIQQKKLEEQRKWDRICTDVMTGMPNRIAFENEHIQWIKTAQNKYNTPTGVLCAVVVSIDYFLKMSFEKHRSCFQEIMQQTAKTIKTFYKPMKPAADITLMNLRLRWPRRMLGYCMSVSVFSNSH
ncbi:MAG TPA: hypothetical protein PKJ47_11960 [Candidatus Limiplasma sp.]|nr:hypothetical protein [Candidatus Limiplasma sp.]